jgi:hypothetical protein
MPLPRTRSLKHHWIPRKVNALYRREPISSFLLTIGAVDAVIGGVGDRSSLLALGVGTLSVAIALRFWLKRTPPTVELTDSRPAVRYLPSASSRPALPVLDVSDRNPSPRSSR